MQVLVLFASIEGQTRKIADFVDAQVRRAGHESTLVDASEKRAVVTFEGYDNVILAAPVHERRHPPNFEIVLTASRADLAARRTMMISVSLGAAFPELREGVSGGNEDADPVAAGRRSAGGRCRAAHQLWLLRNRSPATCRSAQPKHRPTHSGT